MKKVLTIFLLSVLVIWGVFTWNNSKNKIKSKVERVKAEEVIIYKSPTCGCCVKHSAYLKENGYKVNMELTEDMDAIKQKYNIPEEMQSCHTTIIGDYFVEGHIPIDAITKLKKDNPEIDGIALPGMPAGSPGMPGIKTGEFQIYSVKDNNISEFTRI